MTRRPRELTPTQAALLQQVAQGNVLHFEGDPVHSGWTARTVRVGHAGQPRKTVTEIAKRLVRHGFADYPELDASSRKMLMTELGEKALLRARPEHRWPDPFEPRS